MAEHTSHKMLGIEFAPIWIPFERRLQTFAVIFWIGNFLFTGAAFSTLLIYTLLYTKFWYLSVAYVTWMVYDLDTCNRGGRQGWYVKFVRGWRLWKDYANYFPIKLVKTEELNPKKNYLLGSHPHGVLCSGAFASFGTEGCNFSQLFPGMEARLLTLEGQFWIPGYRELFSGSGGCAATKRGIEALLGQEGGGVASVLVVGGAPESLNSDKKRIKLILNKRKGFIKLALRYGVQLVPTFSFGESFIYDQFANPEGSLIRRLQDSLQHIVGFAPVIFFGRGVFQYQYGILPHRKPVTVVVGKPLPIQKIENPSSEDIEKYHNEYSRALIKLYEEFNPQYGDPTVELVIS